MPNTKLLELCCQILPQEIVQALLSYVPLVQMSNYKVANAFNSGVPFLLGSEGHGGLGEGVLGESRGDRVSTLNLRGDIWG